MPHDQDAEMSLIGAAILSVDAFRVAKASGIDHKRFYLPQHKLIWSAIETAYASAGVIDFVTIKNALGDRLGDAGGIDYVVQCADRCPATVNASGYVRIVNECWARRGFVRFAKDIVETEGDVCAVPKLVGNMNILLSQLSGPEPTFAEAMNPKGFSYVQTGIEVIDHDLGGAPEGGLFTITGASGGGKSTIARQMVLFAAMNGFRVGVASSELDRSEWGLFAVHNITGFWSHEHAKEKGKELLYEQAQAFIQERILFLDAATKDYGPDEVCAVIERHCTGARSVFLLDDASDFAGKAFREDHQNQSAFVDRLSRLSRKLGIAIICAVQEKNENGEVTTAKSKAWVKRVKLWTRLVRYAVDPETGEVKKPLKPPAQGEESVSLLQVQKASRKGSAGKVLPLLWEPKHSVYQSTTGWGWKIDLPDPFEMEVEA